MLVLGSASLLILPHAMLRSDRSARHIRTPDKSSPSQG